MQRISALVVATSEHTVPDQAMCWCEGSIDVVRSHESTPFLSLDRCNFVPCRRLAEAELRHEPKTTKPSHRDQRVAFDRLAIAAYLGCVNFCQQPLTLSREISSRVFDERNLKTFVIRLQREQHSQQSLHHFVVDLLEIGRAHV